MVFLELLSFNAFFLTLFDENQTHVRWPSSHFALNFSTMSLIPSAHHLFLDFADFSPTLASSDRTNSPTSSRSCVLKWRPRTFEIWKSCQTLAFLSLAFVKIWFQNGYRNGAKRFEHEWPQAPQVFLAGTARISAKHCCHCTSKRRQGKPMSSWCAYIDDSYGDDK